MLIVVIKPFEKFKCNIIRIHFAFAYNTMYLASDLNNKYYCHYLVSSNDLISSCCTCETLKKWM